MASDLEHSLYSQLRWNGLRDFETERVFSGLNRDRRWRFDVCFPTEMVAVEVMGGLYSGGKHSREKGYRSDSTKAAEAQILGWVVINVTPSMIKDGTAIRLIKEALGRDAVLDGVPDKGRRSDG